MEWDMLKLLVLPCDGYNKFVFPQLTFLLFATNSKTYLPVTEYNLTFIYMYLPSKSLQSNFGSFSR